MARIYSVRELALQNGLGSGYYQMTVCSDEENWPPYGLCGHRHRSRETARACRKVRRRLLQVFHPTRKRWPKQT